MNTSMQTYSKSRYNRIVAKIIIPVLLTAFGMIKVNKGIDLSDTTYNYGNFRFVSVLDDMWFFSTYLANIFGRMFYLLPFGKYMLGMNIYTSLFKIATSHLAYGFSVRKLRMNCILAGILQLTALGLCWCPTSLIYDYCTYLLMAVAVLCIAKAFREERRLFFFLAGCSLGLNVFVRFSNLSQAALIIGVWWACLAGKEKISQVISKTAFCLAGYVSALLLGMITVVCGRGIEAYVRGIKDLFSMGSEVSSYSIKGLILSLFTGYAGASYQLIRTFALLALAVGVSLFVLKKKDRYMIVPGIAAGLVAAAWYVKNKYVVFDYTVYESMYLISVVMITLAIVILVPAAFMKSFAAWERGLFALVIGVIFIAPLGSNNGLYITINNMFLVLPVSLYALFALARCRMVFKPVKGFVCTWLCFLFIQSLFFGTTFVFRDNINNDAGEPNECGSVCANLKTSADNKLCLEKLSDLLGEAGAGKEKILIYGDLPGIAYVFDYEPAISSTWPSLGSYTVDKFRSELNRVKAEVIAGEKAPIVVLSGKEYNNLCSLKNGSDEKLINNSDKKLIILDNFLDEIGYNYTVYVESGNKDATNENYHSVIFY